MYLYNLTEPPTVLLCLLPQENSIRTFRILIHQKPPQCETCLKGLRFSTKIYRPGKRQTFYRCEKCSIKQPISIVHWFHSTHPESKIYGRCFIKPMPSIPTSRNGRCPKSLACTEHFMMPVPSIPTSRNGRCHK